MNKGCSGPGKQHYAKACRWQIALHKSGIATTFAGTGWEGKVGSDEGQETIGARELFIELIVSLPKSLNNTDIRTVDFIGAQKVFWMMKIQL